jgi:hypothetical protein
MEKTEGTERDQLEGTKQTKTNEVSGGGRFDILFHRAVAPRFARCGAKEIGKASTPEDQAVLALSISFAPLTPAAGRRATA